MNVKNIMLIASSVLALGFGASTAVLLKVVDNDYKSHASEKTGMVCFDAAGEITHGEDWRECRQASVRIQESWLVGEECEGQVGLMYATEEDQFPVCKRITRNG